MGPNLYFDKSAFQALSSSEHTVVRQHFLDFIPPILVHEILADLAKDGGAPSEREVERLAVKFGGSGPMVNVDYRRLIRADLTGGEVPMTGQIAPMGAEMSDAPGGGKGLTVDLTAFNHAILRWSRGEFRPQDLAFARSWRGMAQSLRTSDLRDRLRQQHVLIPRPRTGTPEDVFKVVDDLLHASGLQALWLTWIASEVGLREMVVRAALERWRYAGSPFLRSYAPYAHHCLRALLGLVVASHHRIIKPRPTDRLDVQYLFYLPFCVAFGSQDNVHRFLAPSLLDARQSFIWAPDLKVCVRATGEFWSSLDSIDSRLLRAVLGSQPPDVEPNVIAGVWRRRLGAPAPDHFAMERLPPEERPRALELFRRYVRG